MPIRIKCQCGKVLNIKDEMKGKAVKCPGCSKMLRVPAGKSGAPASKPVGGKSQPSSRGPGKSPQNQGSDGLDDLFAEEGFDRPVAAVCPACGAEMKSAAVLCTKCGFNKQTGERLQSYQVEGVDVDMGTVALEKAKRDMAEDDQVQARLLGSGMPTWMLALILFILVSGVTIMTISVNAANRADQSLEFNAMGAFLALAAAGCYMVALGANLILLVKGFQKSVLEGFLCLLVPFYLLYFCIKHWSETWKLLLTAVFVGMVGAGLAAAAASSLSVG